MEWFGRSQDFQSPVRVRALMSSIAGLSGEDFVSKSQTGPEDGTDGHFKVPCHSPFQHIIFAPGLQ